MDAKRDYRPKAEEALFHFTVLEATPVALFLEIGDEARMKLPFRFGQPVSGATFRH